VALQSRGLRGRIKVKVLIIGMSQRYNGSFESGANLKRPAHDEGIFQGALVIVFPGSQDFKSQFIIERPCGEIGGTNLQKNIHSSISLDRFDDPAHNSLSDSLSPKIRMNGKVTDLNLFLYLPVDDVPDNPLNYPVNDHIWKGNAFVYDLARKCGESPRSLEGNIFNFQNAGNVLLLHSS